MEAESRPRSRMHCWWSNHAALVNVLALVVLSAWLDSVVRNHVSVHSGEERVCCLSYEDATGQEYKKGDALLKSGDASMRPLVTAINDAGMAGGWILSEAGSRVVIAQCNTAAARTHRIFPQDGKKGAKVFDDRGTE